MVTVQAEFRGKAMRSLELITDARCIVGEGPIWDSLNGRLLMVDIQGKRMRSIDWQSGRISETLLQQQTGFLFLGDKGEICGGAEDGVYKIESDGSFSEICKPESIKGIRFNDGKVGPDGRLYLGSFSRDNSAAFYRMNTNGKMVELFDNVGNSNGLDWDIQRGIMYYNDTPTGRTDCFEFDAEEGRVYNRKSVISYTGGNPDGMTIDADGNLWTAVWGSGTVVCVNPRNGKIIDKIELPVSQPACCAFAGADLKTLVITTAAHNINLRDEPLAGAVFSIRPGVEGIKPYRMSITK